jgi:hypothetical protein
MFYETIGGLASRRDFLMNLIMLAQRGSDWLMADSVGESKSLELEWNPSIVSWRSDRRKGNVGPIKWQLHMIKLGAGWISYDVDGSLGESVDLSESGS